MSRAKKHFIKINIKGKVLPGSISPSYLSCGKKNCSCLAETPKLHGPYFRWTGFLDGKRKTVTLDPAIVDEALTRIKNFKLLMEAIENIKSKALNEAPWISMSKKT